MDDYRLELDEHDGFSIISISGHTDENIIDSLDSRISKLCEETEQNIVIDLLEHGYLFSKTISSFVKYYKILKEKDLQIVLINASPTVQETLKAAKITKIIPVFKTIDDFLDWSSQSAGRKKGPAIHAIEGRNGIEIITFKVDSGDVEFVHIGNALSRATREIQSDKVILDLSRISTLNSVSVAALIELGKSIQDRNGILILSAVNDLTRELLRLLNISNLFILAEDIDDGISILEKEDN